VKVINVLEIFFSLKYFLFCFCFAAPTRLHPEEWVSGSAAGVSASLWIENNWHASTHVNVTMIQTQLQNIGQPLKWKT
jgi:hypothetical protein